MHRKPLMIVGSTVRDRRYRFLEADIPKVLANKRPPPVLKRLTPKPIDKIDLSASPREILRGEGLRASA